MKPGTKRSITLIAVNTAVMVLLFLIKFVLLPKIEISGIYLIDGFDLYIPLALVPIPLISIIGMIKEQHLRFWIIPDLVYCVLTFIYSGIDHTYGIGLFGLFGNDYYDRRWALADRLVTLVLMLLLQLAVKLIIMLVKKIRNKKQVNN